MFPSTHRSVSQPEPTRIRYAALHRWNNHYTLLPGDLFRFSTKYSFRVVMGNPEISLDSSSSNFCLRCHEITKVVLSN